MRKKEIVPKTKIIVEGIAGFLKERVTPFGNGAKVNCPKKYVGKEVYLIILEDKD